ncbi:MAG: FMN-binding protein [Myxococcales bacterium]|nr:FMN-binding protein [Myxococcales bacterium]
MELSQPIGRYTQLLLPFVCLMLTICVVLTFSGTASAQTVFWTKEAILKDFFRSSTNVEVKILKIDSNKRKALAERLGYDPPKDVRVFYGTRDGKIDGFAIIDNELGQHMPITFAVLVDKDGVIQRTEVMVYRESHGSEVQDQRFRNQFCGKSSKNLIRTGRDIDAVSGATISSSSLAKGVKRAVILIDELILRPNELSGWLQSPGM